MYKILWFLRPTFLFCVTWSCRWYGGLKPHAFPLRQQIIESFLTSLPWGSLLKCRVNLVWAPLSSPISSNLDSHLFNVNTTKIDEYSKRLQGVWWRPKLNYRWGQLKLRQKKRIQKFRLFLGKLIELRNSTSCAVQKVPNQEPLQ